MSAERLREAAKVLRERAKAAPCDGAGWWVDPSPGNPGEWLVDSNPSLICYGSSARNTQDYIATVHPGVGLALADWLDAAGAVGSMPHRFPLPAPDGDIIAWVCQACGETVSEYGTGARTECSVDWRGRDPRALAVADAILGGAS